MRERVREIEREYVCMRVCVCVQDTNNRNTTDRQTQRQKNRRKNTQKTPTNNTTTAEQKDAGRKTEMPSDTQKVLTGYIINTYHNNGS